MSTVATWSPMMEAPEDRPVLLVNDKGDMAVAKWHVTALLAAPPRTLGYWQLTGCALDFLNPIAWAECPKGP